MNLRLTNDPTLDLILVVAFAAMVAIYFLPTVIAYTRQHERRGAILLVDLFLGWTFVGWWFALIWAIVGQREKVKRASTSEASRAFNRVRLPLRATELRWECVGSTLPRQIQTG